MLTHNAGYCFVSMVLFFLLKMVHYRYSVCSGDVLALTLTMSLVTILSLTVGALVAACAWLSLALHMATTARNELAAVNKDMEAVIKAKGKFLVSMGQEIQTPMNALTSFIEILIQRSLQNCSIEHKEDTEGIHEIIKKSIQDILIIINDVFDFIKIDANLLNVQSAPMSLKQVIYDICHAEKPNVVARHLDLSIQYGSKVPPVIVSDPERIRQILAQLIGNAIKFTNKGKITVSCEVIADQLVPASSKRNVGNEKSGSKGQDSFSVSAVPLKISVIDTGIGIAPSQIEELFMPCKHTDLPFRRNSSTCLGLHIAMRLAKLLDGTITVESVLGQGSTFSLLLNVYVPENAPLLNETDDSTEESCKDSRLFVGLDIRMPRNNSDVSRAADGSLPLRNVRVLVVEDTPVNQAVLTAMLREAGAQVEIADNGAVGVQKVMQDIDSGLFFDVILMDLQMPVMNGYEATSYLRKHLYSRPIIAVTPHSAWTDEWKKTVKTECDDYITKPIDFQELIKKIKKVLP